MRKGIGVWVCCQGIVALSIFLGLPTLAPWDSCRLHGWKAQISEKCLECSHPYSRIPWNPGALRIPGTWYQVPGTRHVKFSRTLDSTTIRGIMGMSEENCWKYILTPPTKKCPKNLPDLCGSPNTSAGLGDATLVGGALAGKTKLVYGLGPNPVAGEKCLHFSIFGHFSKFSEL
jgi:hypothetical protein